MYSRSRISVVLIGVLALLAGCDREDRQSRGKPLAETGAGGPRLTELQPSAPTGSPPDPRAVDYGENAFQISQGQLLFQKMNCSGCHAHGGGGMGPALMDDQWRYGSSMEQILATIDQGRPNGMPSWRGKLTSQQMWQLAAYVRSLSAQPRQDALSGRADQPNVTEPPTLRSREPAVPSSPAGVQGTTP